MTGSEDGGERSKKEGGGNEGDGRKLGEGEQEGGQSGRMPGGWRGRCNVQLADEIMLISIISLIFIFAHAPVLSNLIYTKHVQ